MYQKNITARDPSKHVIAPTIMIDIALVIIHIINEIQILSDERERLFSIINN
jgi:hypothetical protein